MTSSAPKRKSPHQNEVLAESRKHPSKEKGKTGSEGEERDIVPPEDDPGVQSANPSEPFLNDKREQSDRSEARKVLTL
ncbi:hypothetical protein MLD38_025471 [Melastoma candidum]|uniref:Uncharacterized protein n=1 Tax=Melastoma candidum TaxID=119954 RepID=A0ACB9NYZ5_9MYRT|nr:hypothetical protein MLD38_025471 [Melastoma candidum]